MSWWLDSGIAFCFVLHADNVLGCFACVCFGSEWLNAGWWMRLHADADTTQIELNCKDLFNLFFFSGGDGWSKQPLTLIAFWPWNRNNKAEKCFDDQIRHTERNRNGPESHRVLVSSIVLIWILSAANTHWFVALTCGNTDHYFTLKSWALWIAPLFLQTKRQTICRYWFMAEFVHSVYAAAARPLRLPSDWQSISVTARRTSFVWGVDAFHPVSIAIRWVNKSLLKNIKTLDSPAGLWWISQGVCHAPLHISHPLCSTPLCFASLKIHNFTYTINHSKDSFSEIFISFGGSISN